MKHPALKLTRIASILALLFLSSTYGRACVFAQDISATGVANTIPIADKYAKDGSIISYQNSTFMLSNIPYDANIFGVITDHPAVSFSDTTLANSRYIVTSGRVYVLVSTKNGSIKKGDLVTTSTNSGIGQKATDAGYILGSAEEDYSGPTIGRILVDLHPEFGKHIVDIKQNLFSTIRLGVAAPELSPVNALRYLLAFLIVLSSFVIGFIFFGRSSSRGVEAIGRNPLARNVITLTVLLNVGLTLIVILAGIAIAYLILVL